MANEVVAEDGAIAVVQGDLTACDVDAIVNAANTRLQHGGGVAAAIAKAAGPALQADSDAWVAERGELDPGVAAVTGGHDLPADHVVHVAGPIYAQGQDNARLLRQAVETALTAAANAGARSVAMPTISAGIYGYPPADAAAVITVAVRDWLAAWPKSLGKVLLVAYDQEMTDHFKAALS